MSTPQSERIHIGFFGCRNAGKSSLVNAVTGQEMSLVSDTLGTTTDPVSKAMELLPLGPVLIVDTPGYDDDDEALGASRVGRARRVLAKTDIAVLVTEATGGIGEVETELLGLFDELKIPYLIAFSKADLLDSDGMRAQPERLPSGALAPVYVSVKTGEGVQLLKDRLASIEVAQGAPIVRDLLKPGDMVVLVTPIDESAPKGRLILPQVQTLRDILDAGAMSMVVKETELAGALASLATPPAMVITDSQAFAEVVEIVPEDIPLTSFSILMARHKGFLAEAVEGVTALQSLGAGDSVLVAEGCTHDRKCNDIATVKIPRWLEKSTGAKIDIQTSTGFDFPQDVGDVRAVVHCGGCMLNAREIAHRRAIARACGVPFTNYGLAIASMLGILERSLSIFPDLAAKLKN